MVSVSTAVANHQRYLGSASRLRPDVQRRTEGCGALTDGPRSGSGGEEAVRVDAAIAALEPGAVVSDQQIQVRRARGNLDDGLCRSPMTDRVAKRLAHDLRELVAECRRQPGIFRRAREMDPQAFAGGEFGRQTVEHRPEVLGGPARFAEPRQVLPHFAIASIHRLLQFVELAADAGRIAL